MSKKRTHEQMLFDLAVNEGPDVVHLPYTPEFEAVCQQLNPQATTADKHLYWEKLLKIKESVASDAEPDSSATPTPTVDVASPRFIPRATEAAHVTTPAPSSGYLFPIEEDITELQPWSSPTEPELQPAHSERRQKLLAEIANSHLATREQQVAYILQRFPETRDSDTALCIRYWRTFQADILEKWSTLELEVLYALTALKHLVEFVALFRMTCDYFEA